jgi:ABC-2 type transport system ATP-binding protein
VEADELCDRVAIINHGKVLACDTPSQLKHDLQKNAIFEIDVDSHIKLDEGAIKKINGVHSFSAKEKNETIQLEIILKEEAVLAEVIASLTRQNVRIQSLQKRVPTLEDVFVKLVGKRMEEEENGGTSSH